MNIIFVESVQSYGGAQIATLDLAVRLRDAGHEVHMIDFYGSCVPFVNAVESAQIPLTVLNPRSEPFIIHKYRSYIANGLRLLQYIPHWMNLKKQMKQTLAEFSPEVIVCYNHKVLSVLSRSSRYKICYYAHGWYLPQQIGFMMKHLLTRRADQIIAISQATRMALYAAGIGSLDKISVVHNAIDLQKLAVAEEVRIPDSDSCYKVLVSGGFLPDKGLHIAVEVAKTLRDRGFPIKLIITGIVYKGAESEPYYEHIINLVAKYGLENQVHVVRDKPNVIGYFRACDCLIHPSFTEGLPLVVTEAMGLEKPVIVNAVGGVTDLVLDGYTGIIAPFNDVEFYADAIEKVASDALFRDFMVANAMAMIEHTFNPKTQITQFEQILKK